ncbi:MAG: LytTR family DNA-binding domain-containing protein [Myxococcota bacterium]
MRVLIVDDEAPAQKRLTRLLKSLRPSAEVEVAEDVDSAERALDVNDFDLVLMDISMPGESGMELYLRRNDLPPVIFITAHSEHALEAFETRAIDYLMKPVSYERFEKALGRFQEGSKSPPSQASASMITARRSGSVQVFAVDSIARFRASSKYTSFEHEGLEFLIEDSLNRLQERFPQFIRVHRAELVHEQYVRSVDRRSGSAFVRLSTGEVVNVSRRYVKPLLDRLGA